MKSKTPRSHTLILAALAIAAVCTVALPAMARVEAAPTIDQPAELSHTVGETVLAGAALLMLGTVAYARQDAELIQTKAMPTGASAVSTDGFDLGHTTDGHVVQPFEIKIDAPALTTGMLGDAATVKYDVECDTDSAFGSARVIAKEVLTQTGAGGAGAAAATKYFRVPTDCERYVRVKATKSASGDASSVSMTAALVF